jgi:hypothetical protein
MSSKYKNGNGYKYRKIDPNRQCIFCDSHVGIANSIVKFCHGVSPYAVKLWHEPFK